MILFYFFFKRPLWMFGSFKVDLFDIRDWNHRRYDFQMQHFPVILYIVEIPFQNRGEKSFHYYYWIFESCVDLRLMPLSLLKMSTSRIFNFISKIQFQYKIEEKKNDVMQEPCKYSSKYGNKAIGMFVVVRSFYTSCKATLAYFFFSLKKTFLQNKCFNALIS